ncbi:MAG: phosphoribosylformylglycinamidine synthase subunit PurQ [Microcoleus sp. SIO2G3]|nr:phosphoribosylformylglycinamidine synthase subunit PurQ [Microcoleus sp. SIO2G3]
MFLHNKALRDLLKQPTRMVWHQETDISDLDIIIIPGGFSYGDYLRCGAIARFSPVMQQVVAHSQKGKPVLGICNGFQVLTEAGLLPGALVKNRDLHFICDRVPVKVERTDLPWTQGYQEGEIITLPIAHGEGQFYADAATLSELEDNNQVLFRYEGDNLNGSVNNIAGICNSTGNVLGMMPHPERASDPMLGGSDGLKLFQGLLEKVVALV